MRPAPSLDGVLADGVREARSRLGLTQDALALRLRRLGYSAWSRSVVAALEAGGRRIDLNEVVGLCLALESPLQGLVDRADTIALNDDLEVAPRDIPQMLLGVFEGKQQVLLRGREVYVRELMQRSPYEHAPPSKRPAPWTSAAAAKRGEEHRFFLLEHARGELEQHAARRLDCTPEEVATAAWMLWRRSATEERERRSAEREGAKQLVSRDLIGELDAFLEREGDMVRELLSRLASRLEQDELIAAKRRAAVAEKREMWDRPRGRKDDP